jgi:cephalosporin hydroxylase
MMNKYDKFKNECRSEIEQMGNDSTLNEESLKWLTIANAHKYSYHFEWMGRPVIQYPQDMVAMQELIWEVKPDLIIETGIAHGGSLILSASILALLDLSEAIEQKKTIDPSNSSRLVLGIDIDIRSHNREAIEAHPMASRIKMLEGSSTDPDIVSAVKEIAGDYKRILVFMDSNHTHEHVLREMELYAPLTSVGSYCVVFDTVIEDLPDEMFEDRPWSKGDNAKTAVWEYLKSHPEFEIDKSIQDKLQITVAPDGYLKRIK